MVEMSVDVDKTVVQFIESIFCLFSQQCESIHAVHTIISFACECCLQITMLRVLIDLQHLPHEYDKFWQQEKTTQAKTHAMDILDVSLLFIATNYCQRSAVNATTKVSFLLFYF